MADQLGHHLTVREEDILLTILRQLALQDGDARVALPAEVVVLADTLERSRRGRTSEPDDGLDVATLRHLRWTHFFALTPNTSPTQQVIGGVTAGITAVTTHSIPHLTAHINTGRLPAFVDTVHVAISHPDSQLSTHFSLVVALPAFLIAFLITWKQALGVAISKPHPESTVPLTHVFPHTFSVRCKYTVTIPYSTPSRELRKRKAGIQEVAIDDRAEEHRTLKRRKKSSPGDGHPSSSNGQSSRSTQARTRTRTSARISARSGTQTSLTAAGGSRSGRVPGAPPAPPVAPHDPDDPGSAKMCGRSGQAFQRLSRADSRSHGLLEHNTKATKVITLLANSTMADTTNEHRTQRIATLKAQIKNKKLCVSERPISDSLLGLALQVHHLEAASEVLEFTKCVAYIQLAARWNALRLVYPDTIGEETIFKEQVIKSLSSEEVKLLNVSTLRTWVRKGTLLASVAAAGSIYLVLLACTTPANPVSQSGVLATTLFNMTDDEIMSFCYMLRDPSRLGTYLIRGNYISMIRDRVIPAIAYLRQELPLQMTTLFSPVLLQWAKLKHPDYYEIGTNFNFSKHIKKSFPSSEKARASHTDAKRELAKDAPHVTSIDNLVDALKNHYTRSGSTKPTQPYLYVDHEVFAEKELRLNAEDGSLLMFLNGRVPYDIRRDLTQDTELALKAFKACCQLQNVDSTAVDYKWFAIHFEAVWGRYHPNGELYDPNTHPLFQSTIVESETLTGKKLRLAQAIPYVAREILHNLAEYKLLCATYRRLFDWIRQNMERHLPKEYDKLTLTADAIPYYGPGPAHPFVGFVLNVNVRTQIHRDDLDHEVCLVLPFGDYAKGELVLHEPGLVIPLAPGDFIVFPSGKISHFNMNFIGVRGSLVLHSDASLLDFTGKGNGFDGNRYLNRTRHILSDANHDDECLEEVLK
ncbi:hypothetical protein EIP91_010935 [Steccherinum ochraceum]|uniref:Uncharacterized protein n=1 Tax=Steccherinum ochraceum TaxID=92696 RepID=A0A4R0R029_9APHY|nr:hypothetical protein EIP91_010935 [Steccherinum ochraceum]